MSGAIPPLPQNALMAWCSVKKKHRDNFTFTFRGTASLGGVWERISFITIGGTYGNLAENMLGIRLHWKEIFRREQLGSDANRNSLKC
jgi:hypothetical protein